MEDLEKVDSVYLKRFNNGYLLASKEPNIAASLVSITNDSIDARGFKAGIIQRLEELGKEKQPQWLKDHSENKATIKDPNKDLDADNRPDWLKDIRENKDDYTEPDLDKG